MLLNIKSDIIKFATSSYFIEMSKFVKWWYNEGHSCIQWILKRLTSTEDTCHDTNGSTFGNITN